MSDNYLRVPNWEKHQHRDLAGKGDMPWFKFDSGIFDDPAICELNANEFRAYVRALTLAARTGNRLPSSRNWLRAHFGRSWEQLCTTLVRKSLLHGTLPPKNILQTGTTHRANSAPTPRLEERRVDKKEQEPQQDARARNHTDNEQAAGTERVDVTRIPPRESPDVVEAPDGWTRIEFSLGDRPAVVASSIGAASSVRSSLLSEFIETKEGNA